jgi:hypothetical protein
MTLEQKVASLISVSTNVKDLKQWRENCTKNGNHDLAELALRRLVEIGAGEEALAGTVEHDFWRSIISYEALLTEEKGKTIKANYTRRKLKQASVIQTLSDFATNSSPSDGFQKLVENGLVDLTGEAIILRHSHAFEEHVVEAARHRLATLGSTQTA